MNIIIRDRGTGKSTQLIYTSATTGFRIITPTEAQARHLIDMASELGLSIPDPMSAARYIEMKNILRDKGILIDELKYILDFVLDDYFGTHVYAGTITG